MSLATDVLDLLKSSVDRGGYIKGLTSEEIAGMTGTRRHDVNKILYDLRGRGAVKFTEKKGGRDGGIIISGLRLRKRVLTEMAQNGVEPKETGVDIWDQGPPPPAPVQMPTEEELAEGLPATPPAPQPPQARYPKLMALLDRKRLAEDAAKNLEALGADTLAVQALELVDAPLTPLQKEIAEFFVRHHSLVQLVVKDNEKNG
jgi:hypothetical protein